MIGNQIPTVSVEPARVGTDGTAAAMLMMGYGVPLADWQVRVVDCWMGKDADGNYVVTSAGLTAPRQNGKNVCLEARELFGLIFRAEHILHTAHQSITAKQSFLRMVQILTDQRFPEINSLVKYIRFTNGEEAIAFNTGGLIEYMCRSRQRARGFSKVGCIIFDEAQELMDDQADAILPTMAAADTAQQIIYAGTPPYPGCPGTVFRRLRKNITEAPGPHDAWHEWGIVADSVEKIDLDNKALWYQTNPGLGINLTEDFTVNERKTLTSDGFARERLGWWSPELSKDSDFAIQAAAWDACKSPMLKPEGKTAYGVKFTYDGSAVALCGAVIPENGPARVSLIEMKPTGHGIQWLADWLKARHGKASCVVIDGRNGADVLVEKISGTWKEKGSVIRPAARDIVAAASHLCTSVSERTLSWYFGQELLRESAVTSIRRPIGGGWGFGGDNSAPIEAAALALWGAKTSKRDPNRQMRIG